MVQMGGFAHLSCICSCEWKLVWVVGETSLGCLALWSHAPHLSSLSRSFPGHVSPMAMAEAHKSTRRWARPLGLDLEPINSCSCWPKSHVRVGENYQVTWQKVRLQEGWRAGSFVHEHHPILQVWKQGLRHEATSQGLQLLGGQVAIKTGVTHLFNVFLSYKYYPCGNVLSL